MIFRSRVERATAVALSGHMRGAMEHVVEAAAPNADSFPFLAMSHTSA